MTDGKKRPQSTAEGETKKIKAMINDESLRAGVSDVSDLSDVFLEFFSWLNGSNTFLKEFIFVLPYTCGYPWFDFLRLRSLRYLRTGRTSRSP